MSNSPTAPKSPLRFLSHASRQILIPSIFLGLLWSLTSATLGYAMAINPYGITLPIGGAIYLALTVVAAIGFTVLCKMRLCRHLRILQEACNCIREEDVPPQIPTSGAAEFRDIGTTYNWLTDQMREQTQTANAMRKEAFKESRIAAKAVRKAEKEADRAATARAEALHQATTQLNAIVTDIRQNSSQVISFMQDVSKEASGQKEGLLEAVNAINGISKAAEAVSTNALSTSDNAQKAMQVAEEGARVVSQSIQAIEELNQLHESLHENMGNMGTEAGNIGSVMDVISDIADQTNLLALNAAIEAARAGDAGRGFAVVADEVRKLAEKTMNATSKVADLVNTMHAVTEANVNGMDRASKAMTSVSSLASASAESLDNILTLSSQTAERIQDIAAAATQQATSVYSIHNVIENIENSAKNNAELTNRSETMLQTVDSSTGQLQRLLVTLR